MALFSFYLSLLQTAIPIGPIEGFPGYAPTAEPSAAFTKFASVILGTMTALAGIWAFLTIVLSGFQYLTSQGDKAAIEKAKSSLTNAIIGLVIILAATAIISLIGAIAGVDFLDIKTRLKEVTPIP